MDKSVLRDISYGMYVVTTMLDQDNVGCVINTLTQITSENPIVTISLNKNNYTNEVIKKKRQFAVSILSEKTDPNIISTFGFKSSKEFNKFDSYKYEMVEGLPILTDKVVGYIICEVINIIDCDTHDIFIAKVIDGKKRDDLKPMTYNYYHEIIKGRAPKNAPTYVEEIIDDKDSEVYVCDICGYVHKGPVPDDFICPICGAGADHFIKK